MPPRASAGNPGLTQGADRPLIGDDGFDSRYRVDRRDTGLCCSLPPRPFLLGLNSRGITPGGFSLASSQPSVHLRIDDNLAGYGPTGPGYSTATIRLQPAAVRSAQRQRGDARLSLGLAVMASIFYKNPHVVTLPLHGPSQL